jgi:hypothetical protein
MTLLKRVFCLEAIVNTLFIRVAALEQRAAALEQSLNQRWFSR